MIIDKPTLQTVIESIETAGCPACGERPSHISVGGPDEIVPSCGHVIDAKEWIDSYYVDIDLN